MKAIVQPRYGSPETLEFQDVDMPVVGDGDVLVRVHAAAVNPQDWHMVTGTPYVARPGWGWRRPNQTVPGTDFAGQVEAVGRAVTRFRPGDEVFGMGTGAFAEYVGVSEDRAVRMPAGVTFEEAAAAPVAGLTALQALRDKGRIRPLHKVLIIGASGGVGTFAVQIAKSYGAEVTGVCSTRNVDTVRTLGADHVVDYTTTDFVHSGRTYDLILDGVGTRSIADRRRVLDPKGVLVVIGGPRTNRWIGPVGALVKVLVAGRFGGPAMVGMLARHSREDLEYLRDLMADGTVTPFVERTYPLREVPEALRYLGTGHARGKLVITV